MLPRTLAIIAALTALAGCGSSSSTRDTPSPATVDHPVITVMPEDDSDINRLLAMAANTDSPAAEQYLLQAARLALQSEDADTAGAILSGVQTDALPTSLQSDLVLTRAQIALQRNEAQVALVLLNGSPFNQPGQLDNARRVAAMRLRAESFVALDQYLAAAREYTRLAALLPGDEIAANNDRIWEVLSATPEAMLDARSPLIDSYELRGWMELITQVTGQQNNLEQQMEAVTRWQTRWNQHSAASQLPSALAFSMQILNNRPQRIALLIPQGEAAGRAVYEGFMAAYYDAVAQQQPAPEVVVFDTTGVTQIMGVYQQAVESGVQLIIGPLRKDSVRDLQRQASLPIPTLALNYGDEGLINPPNLFQFGLAPEDEIRQAARIAWQAGHRSAAILTASGEEYRRIQQVFEDSWLALGGQIAASGTYGNPASYSDTVRQLMNINLSETRASALLSTLPRSNMIFTPRRRQDIDFIFMQASPGEGRQLKPTLGFHFAGDVPVYAMPAIFDGQLNSNGNRDLHGITFVDAPWMLQQPDALQQQMQQIWPDASGPVRRLRAMGVDAYQLHLRLAQLANFPGMRLQGATGTLSMQSDGAVTRELLSAQIVEGRVELLMPSTTDTVSQL